MIAIQSSSRPYVLVLLAGALHPSPLRRQLDVPVLALPLLAERMLLDEWLSTLTNTAATNAGVKIVVSSSEDAHSISHLISLRQRQMRVSNGASSGPSIDVLLDPSPWRGPAGLLRDIAHQSNLSDEALVVCAEAAALPPASLDPLLQSRHDSRLAGAIGSDDDDHPAGVYAFCTPAIKSIPSVGFHDIKEQLLPSLHQRGQRVSVVRLMRSAVRIRDLSSYLLTVRVMLAMRGAQASRSPLADISESSYLSGACIVQDGVQIEDGALVHDSIIMSGARICGGAVVASSVIAPGCVVHPRSVVRSTVVAPVFRPLPNGRANRPADLRASHSPAHVHGGHRT